MISSQLVGDKNETPVSVQTSGSVQIKGREMWLGLKITSSLHSQASSLIPLSVCRGIYEAKWKESLFSCLFLSERNDLWMLAVKENRTGTQKAGRGSQRPVKHY